ncbi:nucleoside phosphorylase [Leptolyngbya sp. PCC 7375]|nr:nucleoside phosphorylase [Leptolyngbya sp. PCC 7375]
MLCAVILISDPDDYPIICNHLTELNDQETHPQGTVYEVGKFSENGQVWKIVIAEVKASNSDAAVETERAIASWEPNVVLSVGTAIGLKDGVNAGDVVAESSCITTSLAKKLSPASKHDQTLVELAIV